jgi:hypothetical protein
VKSEGTSCQMHLLRIPLFPVAPHYPYNANTPKRPRPLSNEGKKPCPSVHDQNEEKLYEGAISLLLSSLGDNVVVHPRISVGRLDSAAIGHGGIAGSFRLLKVVLHFSIQFIRRFGFSAASVAATTSTWFALTLGASGCLCGCSWLWLRLHGRLADTVSERLGRWWWGNFFSSENDFDLSRLSME